MYELFQLEGRGIDIQGYHFPCENPSHVVVIIHGIGEHVGRFKRVASYFNEVGIAVVSMDLRGHGKTEGTRGHCAPRKEVLKDIDALTEYAGQLYPGVPVVYYGHSMGGNITLDYRARGKYNGYAKGYVISAPWIRLVMPVTGVLYQVVKLMSKVAPKATISSSCAEEDLGNPEFVRPYNDDPLVHSKISMLTAYEGFSIGTAIEEDRNEDNGRAANLPILLMHGDADKICSVEGSRNFSKLPQNQVDTFKYREWPGYYHEIHNGGPYGQTGEEVIFAARDFIKAL